MTTTLEIVDTAVKIGLGSFLTGFFAFFTARQKAGLDKKKSHQDELRGLYRQIANETAAANGQMEDFVHLTHSSDQAKVQALLFKNISLLNNCAKHIDQAYALSGLSGDLSLRSAVKEFLEAVYEFQSDFSSRDVRSEYDSTHLEPFINRFNSAQENVLDLLAKAYARTAA